MGRFFVAGLFNVETTAAIDGFPLPFCAGAELDALLENLMKEE